MPDPRARVAELRTYLDARVKRFAAEYENIRTGGHSRGGTWGDRKEAMAGKEVSWLRWKDRLEALDWLIEQVGEL